MIIFCVDLQPIQIKQQEMYWMSSDKGNVPVVYTWYGDSANSSAFFFLDEACIFPLPRNDC